MPEQPQIEQVVVEVLGSAKYRAVSPELVRDLAAREVGAGRSRKEAVKAVKNRLHQVAGAYFDARPDYQRWLGELEVAASDHTPGGEGAPGPSSSGGGLSSFRAACREVMARHASTRERLPILARFYAETLAGLPPIRSVLDVACGLNPLALPWMPLAPGASYHACDLYADLAEFLERFLALAGIVGGAGVCDLVRGAPKQPADLALALKLLPVLEQVDRAAPLRLLRELDAPYLLVSFPTRSLGGRGKGMAENYERRFRELVAGEGWEVTAFVFPGELAFLVRK
jgi:16S rRNA (guanine(1405)-N(7))-methyltransferase